MTWPRKIASSTLHALGLIFGKILPLLATVTIVGLVVAGTKSLRSRPADETIFLYNATQGYDKQSIPSDQLFAFASATLSEPSKKMLAEVATELKKSQPSKIIVVGHTDSIGDAAMNQRLSQERANAVRRQLLLAEVESPSLIAVGVGDRFPIVDQATCKGKPEPELIKCLDKNRRVEIWSRPAQ
ncbi:OmpA family protein [Pseudoduganella chitinolytica]|uniref:OmpA family protein n=1 Tax=Pseudoduganella chitinolytica TaxID=34070 RepID=A0ABY8BGD2_9BURK|nr:OmpA family protein [Pseudoduganella chitinolytica]WEF33354.1 OmpA family protein [Pseudoduganella chitinolytica]